MNKERYNQIIDEAYENFIKSYTGKDNEIILPPDDYINDDGNLMSKNQFITNIKYDYWFSETWGLKIKERELSREERIDLYCKEYTNGIKGNYEPPFDDFIDAKLTTRNIPTRLITLTYNNETLESYE